MSKTTRQVVLHLGAHKTGTSLIQKFLRDRPEEAKNLGFGVMPRSDGNRLFNWGDRTLEMADTTRRMVESLHADGATHAIVSHENALGHPLAGEQEHLYPEISALSAALAHVFAPFEVSLIYYIRSQESFLESYYLQTVHQGSSLTFRQWLDTIELDRSSWKPLVETLRSVFGRGAVTIASFDEMSNGQEEFLRRFVQRVDPTLEPHIDYKTRRNPSIGDLGLEVALAMNPHLKLRAERRSTRKFLQASFPNTKYPRPNLFSAAEIRDIRSLYESENRSLITSRSES